LKLRGKINIQELELLQESKLLAGKYGVVTRKPAGEEQVVQKGARLTKKAVGRKKATAGKSAEAEEKTDQNRSGNWKRSW